MFLKEKPKIFSHHNYNNKKKVDDFIDTLKIAINKKVLIIVKGSPDPDNIASSFAFQYIASSFEIESHILYFEEISHPENQALVKNLGIKMNRYDEKFNFNEYSYTVFNDTQDTYIPIKELQRIQPLILIDHHRDLGNHKSIFTDVRENAGSTSAIYVHYLMESSIPFYNVSPFNFNFVATALMYGIRTDTDNFLLAKDIDFISAAWLSRYVDKDLLCLISGNLISRNTMDITERALKNKVIQGNYLFAGVGMIRNEDRDCIPQVADYLLKIEGIETVIVYGIIGDSHIDGSLRTKSTRLDPDKWIKETLGFNIFNGKAYGGGRWNKGGFQIPLGILGKSFDKDALWTLSNETLKKIFYKKLGIE